MTKINVLALYRGELSKNRGTPIRVRSLLLQVEKNSDVNLVVCSWDRSLSLFKDHFYLNNDHFGDLQKLYRIIKEKKIDIVVGHTIASAYYLVPLKLFAGVKIALEMHGLIEEEAREYGEIGIVKFIFLKLWCALVYLMCDLITTCSKSVTDILLKYNKKTFTLCGGVDLSIFNSKVNGCRFIKKDERVVIGYAGNARIWQGLDFLLDVYKKISEKTDRFRLALLLSDRKGFVCDDKSVELFGPVENDRVPSFLIDCDILVIPRPLTPVTRISFPSKLSEYMAMGKVVIAANTGDTDQVIIPGENGELYTPGNLDELVEKILHYQDRASCLKMGIFAELTAKKLDWSVLGHKFVDFLRELR